MNKYEIYKDADGIYWLVSTHSMRYDTIKEKHELQGSFDLRTDAFQWLHNRSIFSMALPTVKYGYYEIYV